MLKGKFTTVSVFLVSLIVTGITYAACPDIATAIKEINGVTSLSTPTGTPYKYSGTSSYDNSIVYYYTAVQPTAVTPLHQLKLLEAALGTGIEAAPTNATQVSCAYLGTMSGTTPILDGGWQQAIVITSSGSGPTPPPPGPPGPPVPVAVTVTITGDLQKLGGQTVPVTLTGTTIYGPTAIPADGQAHTFGTIDTGFYTASPLTVPLTGTTYYLQSSTVEVTSTGTSITLEYDKTSPHVSIKGWPDYVAMGNITTGAAVFQTADSAHPNLDAAYTYNSINGDDSPGRLIGLPDPALPGNAPGNGWNKVFFVMHDKTIKPQPSLAADTIPFIVYYTDQAGSNNLSGFGDDNSGNCATPTLTGTNNHESLGNLTVQYANLFNFLGLLHYEAHLQPGMVAAFAFNPDLLGGMLQRGLQGGAPYPYDYALILQLPNIYNALDNATQQVNVPICPGQPPPYPPYDGQVNIDPWVHTQLTQNNNQLINNIKAQIANSGGLTGKGYINSINIITKMLLMACGSDCANIQFGWQLNAFLAHGSGLNLDPSPSPETGIKEGQFAAKWVETTGLFSGEHAPDFIMFDKYEADGLSASGARNGDFWNTTTWSNYVGFVGTIAHTLGQEKGMPYPVVLWQIPASHIPDATATIDQGFPPTAAGGISRIDNNTNYIFGNGYGINLQAYASDLAKTFQDVMTITGSDMNAKYRSGDSLASYIGPVSNFQQSHMTDLTAANIVGILWGGGDYTRTTAGFCLLGKGNCVPGTGQTGYNNDNGWLAMVMGNYYQQGGYPLPGLK